MILKEELSKILREYKKRHDHTGPCDYVIFFVDNEGEPVEHLVCYKAQVPSVVDFAEWYNPFMLTVRPMGESVYKYT